jgi:hypothetical protein
VHQIKAAGKRSGAKVGMGKPQCVPVQMWEGSVPASYGGECPFAVRSVRDDLEILGESAHGTGPPTRSGGRTAAKKTAHRFGSISSACFCLCRFKISWMTPCHIARGHVQTKPHLHVERALCGAPASSG